VDIRAGLLSVAPVSARQFAIFRVAFGAYLAVHFAHLIPWGAELFSREGTLADASVSPLHGVFPNVLAVWDTPAAVTTFLSALVVLSLLFSAGVGRRVAAVLLWYGWACLFNRNPLISNPGIPYVGLMLLLTALIPAGEDWRMGSRRDASAPRPAFEMPAWVFLTAWVLMAAGYTYSGIVKLFSPSWLDGSALWHLLNNPLARDSWMRDLHLGLPMFVVRLMTWGALAAEIAFLPLALWRVTRPLAWFTLLVMHLGIVMLVSFADLTAAMLMLHLFTFDARWAAGARALWQKRRQATLQPAA
jgi:hypothetical protein